MKREGDGMPWTAPRKCKRSRLCVSTAGSPDGHLHLVLHFKRRSSFLSLTPSNRVETAQEHRRKPCVDRRVSGKIVKPQRVGSKSRTVGEAKKRTTQLKSVHELEMKSPKSCESHGLESGNKSYVNKVADQKVPEPSTLMRKEERTSHTKEKPMCSKSGKEHRNSTNHTRRYKQYKVKYNGYPSHKHFTPLLNLRTGTTTKTCVKRTPKPNPCHKVMQYNSGHCSEPSENGVCAVESQQKPSLKKKSELACVGTTVEDSRQSKWYVSPITHTRNEEKQLKHIDEKRCNQGEKLAKTKTMSDTATQKLHPDSNRKDSKWEVTEIEYKKKQTVSDNQKLGKLNKSGMKSAIMEVESTTALSIGLFPTCPWEVESDDSSDDSDGEKTEVKLTELGNEQQTVPDNQQLSKVHEPAWKLQGATCETTIESEVQHRNTSCTKAESTRSPTGTSGAMRQKNTAETGRSEKKNFLKEGQMMM
ncbi:PREDICTED: uncharacterized protein LOC109485691 [Branchiostoma belcheri]|uniref:Uncharacterized protein LOC109485691 n=1 Tax=Branchiostoma belcheri TaxID=7741 RepID=A0A6P5APA4_BRABE|nr:PREDICTED: uncharacterized protein LOC109485691 [Branchiostoma belcheri]